MLKKKKIVIKVQKTHSLGTKRWAMTSSVGQKRGDSSIIPNVRPSGGRIYYAASEP